MARNNWGWAVIAVTVLLGLVGSPVVARAYILPADAILASIASRRIVIGFSNLIAEGMVKRGREPPQAIWEAISANGPRRIETKTDAGTQVRLVLRNKTWRFTLGSTTKTSERTEDDLILAFITRVEKDPGGQRGLAFCTKHGIDVDVVSLGRQDGDPVYIIGAKPWEPNRPQLWIHKDLRVPVRWIRVDKQTSIVTEVRLRGFGDELTSEWYPHRVERWENGLLTETVTYQQVKLNQKLDKKLFRPPT